MIVTLSGVTGTGKSFFKNTISEELCFKNIVIVTTREKRIGEINGIDKEFVSEEEFEKRIREDGLLEYAKVHNGKYYGTPKDKVFDMLNKGYDVILEIDIQGALKVKESYNEGIFIFIMPPTMRELRDRLVKRGTESKEKIIERFTTAYKEVNEKSKYNYVVINDKVLDAVQKVEAIMLSEKCRVDRIKDTILDSKEGVIHEQLYD